MARDQERAFQACESFVSRSKDAVRSVNTSQNRAWAACAVGAVYICYRYSQSFSSRDFIERTMVIMIVLLLLKARGKKENLKESGFSWLSKVQLLPWRKGSARQRGKKKVFDLKSGTRVVDWDLSGGVSQQTDEEVFPRSGTKKDLRAKIAQQRRGNEETGKWRGDGGLGKVNLPDTSWPKGEAIGNKISENKEEDGDIAAAYQRPRGDDLLDIKLRMMQRQLGLEQAETNAVRARAERRGGGVMTGGAERQLQTRASASEGSRREAPEVVDLAARMEERKLRRRRNVPEGGGEAGAN